MLPASEAARRSGGRDGRAVQESGCTRGGRGWVQTAVIVLVPAAVSAALSGLTLGTDANARSQRIGNKVTVTSAPGRPRLTVVG